MMEPAQVHLAKVWEWCIVKDNNTQGEKDLKPILTLLLLACKERF